MKKKTRKSVRKTVQKQLAAGVVALIAAGFGFTAFAGDCSHHGCGSCSSRTVPGMQYEMIPHVVLPESIQYHPVAKNTRNPNTDFDRAGDYGMVSPYVASYVPFPSYQLPYPSEMKTVGQAVYPVSPKMTPLPLPLPKKSEALPKDEDIDLTLDLQDAPGDTEVAPVLLASNAEEIVPATPLSEWDNEVSQTGLFCQKTKPPAAWSFSSPLLKVASVPMGYGPVGHTGFINQQGLRGCSTQVGFNPMGGGMMPQDGMGGMMMQPNMNGLQVATLPNGMVLLTAPPDHSGCGLIRCRCGNQPRMMLLPPGSGTPTAPPMAPETSMGMPGMMGAMPFQTVGMNGGMMPMQHPMMQQQAMIQQAMMQQAMMQQMMMQQAMTQPRLMPVTAMTPYGMTVIGYRPMPQSMPMMNPMMAMSGIGMGYGMMPAEEAQKIMQMQASTEAGSARTASEDGKDDASQELKAPLPIAGQASSNMTMPGMMMAANPYAALPYGMYAQQAGATPEDVQQLSSPPMMMNGMGMYGMGMNPMAMNPMMMNPMMAMNPMAMNGMGMNPMMAMNPMMGYGMMPCSANMGGGMNRSDNVTVSDLLQIMMIMNQMNKQEPRRGPIRRLLSRWRDRRDERRADPLQQMMQMWSTPYCQPDTAMRMPSRSAYPYGYFGAQVAPMDTANYGGFYNLSMGNTTYPGMY